LLTTAKLKKLSEKENLEATKRPEHYYLGALRACQALINCASSSGSISGMKPGVMVRSRLGCSPPCHSAYQVSGDVAAL